MRIVSQIIAPQTITPRKIAARTFAPRMMALRIIAYPPPKKSCCPGNFPQIISPWTIGVQIIAPQNN